MDLTHDTLVILILALGLLLELQLLRVALLHLLLQ